MSDLDALLDSAVAAPIDPELRLRARARLDRAMAPRRAPARRRRLAVCTGLAIALAVGAVVLAASRRGAAPAYAAVQHQLRGVGRFPLPGRGSLDTGHASVLGRISTPSGAVYIVSGLVPRSFKGVSAQGCAGLLSRFPFPNGAQLPGGLYFGLYSCGAKGGMLMSGPIGHAAFLYGHVADGSRSVTLTSRAGTHLLPVHDGYYGAALRIGTRPPVQIVERAASGRTLDRWTIDPALLAGKLPRKPAP